MIFHFTIRTLRTKNIIQNNNTITYNSSQRKEIKLYLPVSTKNYHKLTKTTNNSTSYNQIEQLNKPNRAKSFIYKHFRYSNWFFCLFEFIFFFLSYIRRARHDSVFPLIDFSATEFMIAIFTSICGQRINKMMDPD